MQENLKNLFLTICHALACRNMADTTNSARHFQNWALNELFVCIAGNYGLRLAEAAPEIKCL